MSQHTFASSLADRLDLAARQHQWRADPAAWAMERLGVHLWSAQRRIAGSLVEHRRTAVQSAAAVGKSYLAAVFALWWVDTHPPGDAIVVSTAPGHEQVHAILWEYIRQLHTSAGDLPGRVQQSDRWLLGDGTLVGIGRRPPDHQQSAFQGIHRRWVLVILDEAGGIPQWLWNATEAITTGDECRILAIGNPDDNTSTFARVCGGQPGWARHKVSAFDTPNLTGEPVPGELAHRLVTRATVDDLAAAWGETNPLYQAKVLGEFADSEDGLIPLSWVRAANARWQEWHDAGGYEPAGRRVIGCDPARYGQDKTALAVRQGDVVMRVSRHAKLDTTETTGLVEAELAHPRSVAVVDVIGLGAGVVDQLRHRRWTVQAFNAAEGTRMRDVTGKWRFNTVRSAAWHHLAELLDPAKDATLALPPDDELTADLTTPTWRPASGARLVVESKDDIRKRLGRSTDTGDAVVQAIFADSATLATQTTNGHPRRPRPVAYSTSVGAWT